MEPAEPVRREHKSQRPVDQSPDVARDDAGRPRFFLNIWMIGAVALGALIWAVIFAFLL